MEEAIKHLRQMCLENKDYFDDHHQIHLNPLKKNDMVLLHNTVKDANLSSSNTLHFHWLGPYCIHHDNGNRSYVIKELNRTVLSGPTAGNHLKCFHPQGEDKMSFEDNQQTLIDSQTDNDDSNNEDNTIDTSPANRSNQQDNDPFTIPDGWDLAVII